MVNIPGFSIIISVTVNNDIACGSEVVDERPVRYLDYKFPEIVCQ